MNFSFWIFQVFTDGATNKLIGCYHKSTEQQNGNGITEEDLDSIPGDDIVLIRIYGNKTDLLIDRKQEIKDFKLLHSYGFASRLLATFTNGLAYEYVRGVPTTKKTVRDEKVSQEIAKRMAEMHRVVQRKGHVDKRPVLWWKIEKFFDLIPRRYTDPNKQKM